MKASELRIGNYVNTKDFSNLSVLGISTNNVGLKLENTKFISVQYNELNPIPLTKEWLLKFGFEFNKHKNWHNFKLKDFYINYSKIDIEDLVDANCFYSMNGNIKIKYVHELQNVYYVFYKKELTINEL